MDKDVKPIPKFSAGGVIYENGKILTIKWLSRNTIGFPKGTIEAGETHEQTCIREVFEETGYKTKIIKSLDDISFEYVWDDGLRYFKTVYFFLLKLIDDGEPTPNREDGEDFENLWLDIDKADDYLSFETSREILKRVRQAID